MNTKYLPAGAYTIRDGQYVPAKDGDLVYLIIPKAGPYAMTSEKGIGGR